MNETLIATVSIQINATAKEVWEALTTPELIKKYFFGTEAISDWKVGSTLHFKGVWEGKEYLDKGNILEIIPEKLLRYNYFSSFSGLEDIPANYHNISYTLSAQNNITTISVTQDGVATTESKQHSEQNWMMVLKGLKDMLEAK